MSTLSPVVFKQQAEQFLGAAEREFERTDVAVSLPAYFLAARSLELALKSFLLVHGAKEKALKKIGHDLERGLAAARERCLDDVVQIEDREEEVVSWLNAYYASKDLEYVKTGYKSYPESRFILATARRILDGITPTVRAWRPDE